MEEEGNLHVVHTQATCGRPAVIDAPTTVARTVQGETGGVATGFGKQQVRAHNRQYANCLQLGNKRSPGCNIHDSSLAKTKQERGEKNKTARGAMMILGTQLPFTHRRRQKVWPPKKLAVKHTHTHAHPRSPCITESGLPFSRGLEERRRNK